MTGVVEQRMETARSASSSLEHEMERERSWGTAGDWEIAVGKWARRVRWTLTLMEEPLTARAFDEAGALTRTMTTPHGITEREMDDGLAGAAESASECALALMAAVAAVVTAFDEIGPQVE